MTAPCAVRRPALFLFTSLALLAPAGTVPASPLPPAPVLGHQPVYVIVTPAAFAGEFQTLARWKTRQGLPAFVKPLEAILDEYPAGRDEAERVRMFLQDAHAQWGTHWVLLGGVPPYVPARRVHSNFFGGADLVTDLYFGALAGTWDHDGDGIFGEGYGSASDPGDSVDLHADVFVGRAPVRSAAEAHDFVHKTLLAGFDPVAPTPHRVLLGAEVLFPRPWTPGMFITFDGTEITEPVRTIALATPGVEVQRLYQNWMDPRWPDATDFTRSSLLAALHAGTDFLVTANGGGPLVMTAVADSVTAADLAGLADAPRPTHAWLTGSFCGNFEGDCFAAAFVRGASGGAATCVAHSGTLFATASEPYLQGYVTALYAPDRKPVGEALALAKEPLAPFSNYDGVHRLMQFGMNLIGDPALRLRFPSSTPLAVEFPASVTAGAPGFDVDVTSAGTPVEGGTVCAYLEDQALAMATTGADGLAHLEMPAGSAGTADLTVTGPDGSTSGGSLLVGGVTGVGPFAGGARFATPQPNPAFASARFTGAVEGPTSLDLFDVGGRRVRSFVLESGPFDLRWDLRDAAGRRVSPGLYLARLGTAGGVRVQRLLVSR